jgi:hypothetical protein
MNRGRPLFRLRGGSTGEEGYNENSDQEGF